MTPFFNIRVFLFIVFCWVIQPTVFAQNKETFIPLEDNYIEIFQIGEELLNSDDYQTRRNNITIHSFDDFVGEEIKLKVWAPVEPNKTVYLMIHDINANIWFRSPPAKKVSEGIWRIHNVRFGRGQYQGQRFTLKAVIVSDNLLKIPPITEDWENQAIAISSPIHVEIKERKLINDLPIGKVYQDQIWISTLNNQTVSTAAPTLVSSISTISGTFATVRSQSSNLSIYILISTIGDQKFRVLGPAKIDRTRWTIPEAFLHDPNSWNPGSTNLIAVILAHPIENAMVEKPNWEEDFLAVSDPIKVGLKPLNPILKIKPVEIKISHAKKINGNKIECCDRIKTDTLEKIISLSGTVENLPEKTSIWVILNPIGTDIWEVYGRSMLQFPQWKIDMIHPKRLAMYASNDFQIKAIVTHENLNPGIIYTEDWKRKSFSESESFLVHQQQTNYISNKDVSISISKLGGKKAKSLMTKIKLQDNSQSGGKVIGVFQDMEVWIGVRSLGETKWNFSGPAKLETEKWNLSGLEFFESGIGKGSSTNLNYDIIAIVTLGKLPIREINNHQIHDYAMATSSILKVREDPQFSLQNLKQNFFSLKMMNMSLLIFLFLLLLLFILLEYFFRLVSKTAQNISGYLMLLADYIKNQFPEIPKPELKTSVLGLGIFMASIFAIIKYYPIYTHALESVLGLSLQKSAALALLMIIFTGLAGVIIHLSIEYGKSETRKNSITTAQVIIILITGCLWSVQTLIYYKLYLQQVPVGEILVPIAMGIAAFFIAAMETLGFYWAVKFGITLITWLFYHMLLYGPPIVGYSMMKIIEKTFRSLPSRLDSKEDYSLKD